MIVFTSDVSVLSFCYVGVKIINELINQGIVTNFLFVEACKYRASPTYAIFTTTDSTTAIFGYVLVSGGFLH